MDTKTVAATVLVFVVRWPGRSAGDAVATKLTRNVARVVVDRLMETNTRIVALGPGAGARRF